MHLVKDLWVSPEVVDEIYAAKQVYVWQEDEEPAINSYVVMRSVVNEKHTALARYSGHGDWHLATNKIKVGSGVTPRDAHQAAFADALLNENILVNAAVGAAGTGKTTLAAAYACEQYLKAGKKILLCKPTVMVGAGKAFGPIPGDIQEKYAPYLYSFEIVLKKLLSEKAGAYLENMRMKGDLQFVPLELARGCTYENCTFILDEAQNIGWHEMNTLMSRIGEGSKMIVLGDLNQIDIRSPAHKTGLGTLVASRPFSASSITSVIELETQYRSPICQLATEIDKWVKNESR
jgi:PhoH-like ATPase